MTEALKNAQNQRLVSRGEVADQLRVSPQTVDKLVQRGALPAPIVRSGRIVRFDGGAIDRVLSGGQQ